MAPKLPLRRIRKAEASGPRSGSPSCGRLWKRGPERHSAEEESSMTLNRGIGVGAASLRPLLVAIVVAALASSLHATARAGGLELIPSIGLSKATDSDGGDAKVYGGVALRASVLPFLKAEGGIAYREEEILGDAIKQRIWPVTASLWLAPV